MKSKILLLALTVALFTSCTTAYKTGQTPDDVYFSPSRPDSDEYVKNEREDRNQRRYDDEYYEDQYLRMKIRDRYRWSELDDPYYYRSRYNYVSYNCGCFGNPWTPYTYWNNYYNPYYQNHVILNPKTSVAYTGPRTFNLNTYNTNALTNSNYSNPKFNNSGSSNSGYNSNIYNAPRNTSPRRDDNTGNILREVFRGSSNTGTQTNSSSGNNNSSSGSSSSSSSGSSTPAPVRKF